MKKIVSTIKKRLRKDVRESPKMKGSLSNTSTISIDVRKGSLHFGTPSMFVGVGNPSTPIRLLTILLIKKGAGSTGSRL